MFKIKNAIMDALAKTNSILEILQTLDEADQYTFLHSLALMKAKISGHTESFGAADNGQWTLSKNTIDYSKLTAPIDKPKDNTERTLDYQKLGATKPPPKPWAGSVARRDAVRAKIEEEKYQKADSIDDIKAKYRDPVEPSMEDRIREIKEKYRKKVQQQANEPVVTNTKLAAKKPKP